MRRHRCLFIIAGLLLAAANTGMAQPDGGGKVFRARDYGAVPNGDQNAAPAIQAAIQAAIAAGPGAEVVLEAGRYRLAAHQGGNWPLAIRGADGLTLRGAGAQTELVVTNPANYCLIVDRSRSVTAAGFAVDYDPLPFTQGRIVAADKAGKTFDLELEAGYPALDQPYFAATEEPYGRWGMIFDPAERHLKEHAPDNVFIKSWEPLGDRRWRLHPAPEHAHNVGAMAPGDRFVHLARLSGGTLAITNSEGCAFENVTVYASPGLCAVVSGCRGTRIRNYQVCWRPGTTRLISSDSDGLHCPDNPEGPRVENCLFEGMADDAINIYNRPAQVAEVISPTEIVAARGGRIEPGDRLEVYDARAGRVRADVTAAQTRRAGRGAWRIQFDRPVPGVQPGEKPDFGDLIYNLSRCGAGSAIRNNIFRLSRRYGVFINSIDGVVENNLFDRLGGWAIVLDNEISVWQQGPPSRGLLIRNNVFRGVAYTGHYGDNPLSGTIRIVSQSTRGPAEGRPIRGIRIDNNAFENVRTAAVSIGSATDINLKNNAIRLGPDAKMGLKTAAITLRNAEGILIENLAIDSARPETAAGIAIDARTAPGAGGVAVKNLAYRGPAGAPAIADERPAERQGDK
ncbi:MAG: right-handed parallel beta-helix repeat-containing protein [bacterium]|nr:right-handed parallel beta-helix repeat-containing protein [bacterium]